ncbi:MAG: response regulator [Chloroflexi bacterium]|nr:response regulator [Chloroflexota bacterium]
MAGRILLVDSDPNWASFTLGCLRREGYRTMLVNGLAEGLEKASKMEPDLILVDADTVMLPWEELASEFRKEPAIAEVPFVLLTSQGLDQASHKSDAEPPADVLFKPFEAEELLAKIRPLLQNRNGRRSVISTGNAEMDGKMGGGIPLGSLTLVEGSSGAGKSVLVQQLIWGSLHDSYRLALFTSENTVRSLVSQMQSLSLNILDYLLLGKLGVYPIEVSGLGSRALDVLLQAISSQSWRDMIFIDSLTSAMAHCAPEQVLGFLEGCKRLCANGVTIVVVLHSHSVTKELLIRIRSLCDAHLQLRTEEMGQKLIRMMEVTKIRGADKTTGNIISFDVEPGWGMRIIPINKVKG